MKKVYCLVAVGLLTVGLTGCNRGWPRCFGCGLFNRNQETYETYYDSCDECGESYYDDTSAEWVPVSPQDLPPVPTQAPAKAADTSADR
jgi:hypothetical protein